MANTSIRKCRISRQAKILLTICLVLGFGWLVWQTYLQSRDGKLSLTTSNPLPVSQNKASVPSLTTPAVNSKTMVPGAESLLRVNPKSEAYYEDLAALHLKSGDQEGAEQWLRKVLEINPRNRLAIGLLTELLNSTGHTDEAIANLKDIVASCHDECPDANLALGTLLTHSNDLSGAIAELKQASQSSSLKEAALRGLVVAYLKNGDSENALATQAEIIKITQSYMQSLRAQGIQNIGVLEKSLTEDLKKLAKLEGKEAEPNHF